MTLSTHQAKRYSRKKVFKGYCYEVVVDQVSWPNGKTLRRDLIVHPGISIFIPLLGNNQMILVRQFRYGAGKVLWELPAGTIHGKETPLACAKREIIEEVGYRAKHWKKIGVYYASPGYTTEVIHGFVAADLIRLKPCPEADEVLEEKIFKIAEVKQMIRKKQIEDARSLTLLFDFFYGRGKK